jgi:hypothetical protein
LLIYLSIVFIASGAGLAVLATRLTARQALCEAVAGVLLINGLLLLGAAFAHMH